MFNNLQNMFGCGEGIGDNLLFFFLILIAISCFCNCGENNGLLNAFGGCEGDSLLFFFLILVVLFCTFGGKEGCEC